MKTLSKLLWVAVVVIGGLAPSSASAQNKIHFVDLNPYANRKLSGNLGSGAPDNSLSELPTGEQTLAGVKFKVGPGLIQLGSTLMESWPEKVEDIVIDRKVARLHFLHATSYGGGPNQPGGQGFVADGIEIGKYKVHYDDDSQAEIPITYGEDVRDWWYLDGEAEPSKGKVAWKGDNEYATRIGAHLRLYVSTWTNPKPDKKVLMIDYTSMKDVTPAAPFCISLSVEGP
jgi:hypothetical protein